MGAQCAGGHVGCLAHTLTPCPGTPQLLASPHLTACPLASHTQAAGSRELSAASTPAHLALREDVHPAAARHLRRHRAHDGLVRAATALRCAWAGARQAGRAAAGQPAEPGVSQTASSWAARASVSNSHAKLSLRQPQPGSPSSGGGSPHLDGQRLARLEEGSQQRVAVADLLGAQAPAVAQVAVLLRTRGEGGARRGEPGTWRMTSTPGAARGQRGGRHAALPCPALPAYKAHSNAGRKAGGLGCAAR